MPRVQKRDAGMAEVRAPRPQRVAANPPQAGSELADFLAAQTAAFEDGRAYLEARRQRPRKQS
jgi:hypothetical protein